MAKESPLSKETARLPMNIHTISTEQEKRAWIDPLGPTFDPASDAGFAAFEKLYLSAYDFIMAAIAKVASLQEDGEPAQADLATSRWMNPQRLFGVVVCNKAVLQPALFVAIHQALEQLARKKEGKFAVALDAAWPTKVYILPGNDVLIWKGTDEQDLTALGIK